jgi:hypothetical protein
MKNSFSFTILPEPGMPNTRKKISNSDIRLFLIASYYLYFAQFLILFIPFRWYIALFKDRRKQHDSISDEKILLIRIALLRGLNYLPWKGKCLAQALAGKLLLKKFRMPGTIFFGVMKVNDKMKAHAWLISGTQFICGKKSHKQYTIVNEVT